MVRAPCAEAEVCTPSYLLGQCMLVSPFQVWWQDCALRCSHASTLTVAAHALVWAFTLHTHVNTRTDEQDISRDAAKCMMVGNPAFTTIGASIPRIRFFKDYLGLDLVSYYLESSMPM